MKKKNRKEKKERKKSLFPLVVQKIEFSFKSEFYVNSNALLTIALRMFVYPSPFIVSQYPSPVTPL